MTTATEAPPIVFAGLARRGKIGSLEEHGHRVVVVGSAQGPGRVFDAIHSAFFEARIL